MPVRRAHLFFSHFNPSSSYKRRRYTYGGPSQTSHTSDSNVPTVRYHCWRLLPTPRCRSLMMRFVVAPCGAPALLEIASTPLCACVPMHMTLFRCRQRAFTLCGTRLLTLMPSPARPTVGWFKTGRRWCTDFRCIRRDHARLRRSCCLHMAVHERGTRAGAIHFARGILEGQIRRGRVTQQSAQVMLILSASQVVATPSELLRATC